MLLSWNATKKFNFRCDFFISFENWFNLVTFNYHVQCVFAIWYLYSHVFIGVSTTSQHPLAIIHVH